MQMYWAFLTSMHCSASVFLKELMHLTPPYRVSGIVRNLKKTFFLHKRITRCSNRFWNAAAIYTLILLYRNPSFLIPFSMKEFFWRFSQYLIQNLTPFHSTDERNCHTTLQKLVLCTEWKKGSLSNNIPIGYISW